MSNIQITLTEDQLTKVIDAYRTIQEFLALSLSPNELYLQEFLNGLKEANEDVRKGNFETVSSFNDFIS